MVNSQTGTVTSNTSPVFLGFDVGNPGTLNVSLTLINPIDDLMEIEVRQFFTALPEPTSWAMIVSGLAVARGALRHRRRVTVIFA